MKSAKDSTSRPILAPARASQSASGLSSAAEAASAWNLSQGGVRHFTLRSRLDNLDAVLPPVSASIVLVEDNSADAGLVRMALESHGVGGEITVFSDGEKAIQFIEESVDGKRSDALI